MSLQLPPIRSLSSTAVEVEEAPEMTILAVKKHEIERITWIYAETISLVDGYPLKISPSVTNELRIA